MSQFRRRIENSTVLAGILARIISVYLRLCQRTTRWTVEGEDQLRTDLADGPVLVVMWHDRSMLGPLHWPHDMGLLSSLYDRSPIGRVSGAFQRLNGMKAMEMADNASNVSASRIILKRVREGISIGLTGDGPLGPARVMKSAPIDWARAMQRPVYAYAFSTTRNRRLDTWDRMMLPRPWSKGAICFQRWDVDAPRKADATTSEALRIGFETHLNATTARADAILDTQP